MFEYNGTEFTLEQVEKAATAKGLSVDEYISTYNIVKKDKDEEEVKTEAVVEDEIAPAAAETVVTESQSGPGSSELPARRSIRNQVRQREIQKQQDKLQDLELNAINNLNKAKFEESFEDFTIRKINEKKSKFDKGQFSIAEKEERDRYLAGEDIVLDEAQTLKDYSEEVDVREREFMEDLPDSVRKNVLSDLKQQEVLDEEAIDAFQRSYSTIDQISNTLRGTATDVGLGSMYLLDMLKDEEGKAKSYSSKLLENKKAIEKERAEKLPKPIALENINSLDALGSYVGDAFVNFVPSAALLATGPGALPGFGIMGATGKLSEYALEEDEAKANLPILEAALETEEDPNILKQLNKEIERYNTVLDTSNLTKLATAGIYAGAEVVFERLGTVKLLGDLKKAAKLKPPYREGIAKAISEVPKAMFREGGTEGLTQITQNLADIVLNDEDKSILENVDEAAVQGALIGSGFGAATGGIMARASILDVISDKQDKKYISNELNQINILNEEMNNPEVSNDRKLEIKKIIKKKVDNISLNQDIVADRFLRLTPDQQQEVFELDRKSRKVNNEWINSARDSSLSEAAKDIIEQDLRTEFDALQQQKRDLINSADNRYKALEEVEGLEEGTLVRNKLQADTFLRKVRQHNKGTKWADKITGVSEADLQSINNFISSNDTTLTLEDGSIINQADAELIQVEEFGKDGFFDKKNKHAVVFTDRTPSNNKAAAIHEYMHAAFAANGLDKTQFDNVKDDLIEFVNNKAGGELTQEQTDEIINKINAYENVEQSEELFTAISDLISLDVIRESDISFLTKFKNNIKSSLSNLIGLEQANEFNFETAEDAFAFIKDFNKKVIKEGSNITGRVSTEPQEGIASSKIIDLYNKYEGNKKSMIEQGLIKTPSGQETFDFSKSEFGEAIGGLTESITKRIYDRIPADLRRDISRQEFKNDLISNAATFINNEFDPSKQDIGKFTVNRLNLRANRIPKELGIEQQFTEDINEARAVSSDERTDDKILIKKPIVKSLNLSQDVINKTDKLAELAVIKADNSLKGKDVSDSKKIAARDKAFNQIFGRQLFNDIKQEVGKNTKTSDDFSKYLNKNYETLLNAALNNIDFQKGSGVSFDWNTTPPTKEEFIDYYEGTDILPSQPNSVKSDRKKSLINAISRQIANEARIAFAKKDPATAEMFKKDHGVVLASYLKPKNRALQTLASMSGYKDGAYNPAANMWKSLGFDTSLGYDWNTEDGQNKFISDFEKAVSLGLPLDVFNTQSKIFLNPRQLNVLESERSSAKRKFGKNSKEFKQADMARSLASKSFRKKLNDSLDKIKKSGNYVSLNGEAKNWKPKNFITAIGDNPRAIEKANKNGTIGQLNKSNLAMFEQTMRPLYEMIVKNPDLAQLAFTLTPTSYGTSGWFRFGAEVVGYSKELTSDKNRAIEWEHAMQANNARMFLINSAINKVPWTTAYPAVKRNYKVIGLDKAYDDVLKSANRGNNMSEGWNVYTDSWTQRYFSPEVAIFGGINPETIVDLNGITFGDLYNIDETGQSKTEIKSSKILNEEFNKILESTKKVPYDATYSEARAIKLGKKNNPFKFFVPYSADDYLGLVYATLGKGKKGDENLKWYKENLIDVYARGVRDFEIAKQDAMNNWINLKNAIKNTPAKLSKEAVRDFTNEEAVRLYLWDKQKMLPENVAKKDIDAINKYVDGNSELKSFAEQIQDLVPNGYPAPTGDWLAGTITTDLVNYTNTVSRKKYLQPWKDNIDAIYNKDNLNKLKALYGENYVDALQNMLYRMETGRNRPQGSDKLTNEFLNYVNDSVGTIMFFNTRSALLQTLSSINYINFTDNNPLRAAAAFSNQPQFWKDFSFIFNSDFLKQRRSGLKTDVNADEIARQAATSTNKVRAGLAAILKKGFLPTQIADSFAISIGGASFYRNRVKALKKQGMTEAQAKEQAFLDFKETTEESQQSSRADRVSMQQASPLGRIILAFANTPMQYTRLTKKAALDLINKRGDWKTNLSKLIYYGAVQNIIFTALQSAMFAMMFNDEETEKEKEKYGRIGNGIADTLLRGSGVYGAGAAMLKNIVMEAIKQYNSGRPNYVKAASKITSISPPIDSKIRKLQAAGRTFTYRQEIDKMKTKGFAIDNPAYMAGGQIASALVNIPLDRAVRKMNNLKTAVDKDTEMWQSIALALGYSTWDLGMIENDTKESYGPVKRKLKKLKLKRKLKKSKLKRSSLNKGLPDGVLGRANNDGTIEIKEGLSPTKKKQVIAHEKKHIADMKSGKLNYDDNFVYYKGNKHPRVGNKIEYKGRKYLEGSSKLPWEAAANKVEKQVS